MDTFISGKDYLNIYREFENIAKKDQMSRDKKEKLIKEDYEYTQRKIVNAQSNRALTMKKYNSFVVGVKQSFITEALHKIVAESLDITHTKDDKSICKNIVSEFVKNNDSTKILNTMKTKSMLLSELAYIIEKCCDKATKCVDKDNPDSFIVNSTIRDEFYDELDKLDIEDITSIIRSRVGSAASEFITTNTMDKLNIKSILQDAKDKIEHAKNFEKEKLEETVNIIAKRRMQELRNSGSKNLYHTIVESIVRKAFKDENVGNIFREGIDINMDKIVSYSDILYTFLEAMNTIKLNPMTESSVLNFIKTL